MFSYNNTNIVLYTSMITTSVGSMASAYVINVYLDSNNW